MAGIDILQLPVEVGERIERVGFMVDDNEDRIGQLEAEVVGPLGLDAITKQMRDEIKKLQAGLLADVPAIGDKPAADPEELGGDENMDTNVLDAEVITAEQPSYPTYSLAYSTIDGRVILSGIENTHLYGYTDTHLLWDGGAEDRQYGIPMFNKEAESGALVWTGLDSDFSTQDGATDQRSISRSQYTNSGNHGLDELLQIYWMDQADAGAIAAETTSVCYRTGRSGQTRFGTMNFAGISSQILHSELNPGDSWNANTDHDVRYDGRYWKLTGEYNDHCYGGSIGRNDGDLAIELAGSELYDSSGDPAGNKVALDWNARIAKNEAELEVFNWNSSDWYLHFATSDIWNDSGLKIGSTTAAGAGTGSLVTLGGASIAKKLRVEDTTVASASAGAIYTLGGIKADGGVYATSGTNGAGEFYNGSDIRVILASGTYGVDVTNTGTSSGGVNSDSYFVDGTAGIAISDITSKGIVTGGSAYRIRTIDADSGEEIDIKVIGVAI